MRPVRWIHRQSVGTNGLRISNSSAGRPGLSRLLTGCICATSRRMVASIVESSGRVFSFGSPLVFLTIGLSLGLLGCAGNREAVRREAQTSYKLGVAYLTEGKPSPALQELTKAETLTPDDAEIQNALGLAYWARREQSLAEGKFRRATELRPDYSEAWNNLGALYLDQGRYDAAVPALETALKNVFYDTQERALTNLGWALFKLGRTAEAERQLRHAIEVAPAFSLAHKNLGILLQERGEHSAALVELQEALRLFPGDADANLRKGISFVKLGDRDKARSAFEAAWRLAPGTEVGKSAKNYLDLLR